VLEVKPEVATTHGTEGADMTLAIRQEPGDVKQRLAELSLDADSLKKTVQRGQLAFISCTANHPPQFPGMAAWAETVRALREYVIPLNWQRSNDNNYALTVSPDGRMAIAVATGNESTGKADAVPSTNAPKGPSTSGAVATNQLRFSFMNDGSDRGARSSDENE
jgi:hypothetical protein